MNTEKTFETTYFYWELKNGKPTGKLKSKKCKFYEEIGEKVYIVPLQENDKIAYLSGNVGESGGTKFLEINTVKELFSNKYRFHLPQVG